MEGVLSTVISVSVLFSRATERDKRTGNCANTNGINGTTLEQKIVPIPGGETKLVAKIACTQKGLTCKSSLNELEMKFI